MTETEWIRMGYQNGLITRESGAAAPVSFAEAFELWFRSRLSKVKPQSLDRIEVTYRKYYKDTVFDNTGVSRLESDYIISFLNKCIWDFPVTYKEYCRIYQIVSNVMNYAHDFNIGSAPLIDWAKVKRCVSIDKVEHREKEEFIISDMERYKLFRFVLDKGYSSKQSAGYMLLLNFYLGLRVGELAALRFSDFDLNNKTVTIRRTEVKNWNRDDEGNRLDSMAYRITSDLKTASSYRVLPLLPEAEALYWKILMWHSHRGYRVDVMCYDGTDTIASRSLERTLARLCKLTGIRPINTHLIRKTYASLLHGQNIPTKAISDLLGHSDMATTERYYILNYQAAFEKYRDDIAKALSLSGDEEDLL